jgi:uncharacterized membrane protein
MTTMAELAWRERSSSPVPNDAPPAVAHWRLTRRCALTPRQLLLSYVAVVVLSSVAGVLFGSRGFWMIPLYCLFQIVLAGAMYLCYTIHAVDGERITLGSDGQLVIEVTRGLRTRRYVMNGAWSRLEQGGPGQDHLWLCCRRTRVEVGTQLRPRERRRIGRELRRSLRAWQFAGVQP